jgi:hypothetical protein
MEDHPHPLVVHQGREDVKSQPLLVNILSKVTIPEPTGPFERALARLLMVTYKRRLRGIVEIVPAWVSEEILSASVRRQSAPPLDFCPQWQYTICV